MRTGAGPPGTRSRRRPGDRGAGSVLGLSLVSVVLVLAVGVTALAGAVHARGVAQTAADLGALAAAEVLHGRDGQADPCGAAARVVRANGAEPGGCVVRGDVVEVVARVTVPVGPPARATARAGPA